MLACHDWPWLQAEYREAGRVLSERQTELIFNFSKKIQFSRLWKLIYFLVGCVKIGLKGIYSGYAASLMLVVASA